MWTYIRLMWSIFNLYYGKEVNLMMILLLAMNIVDGLMTFKQVPRRYREKVREQLRLLDAEDLATE